MEFYLFFIFSKEMNYLQTNTSDRLQAIDMICAVSDALFRSEEYAAPNLYSLDRCWATYIV